MMPGMPGGHGGHGHAHGPNDGHGHGNAPKIKVNPKLKLNQPNGAKLKLNTAPKGGAAPAPKQ
jgi:hypothetical protein